MYANKSTGPKRILLAALLAQGAPGNAAEPVVLPNVEVVERYDNPIGASDSASEGIVTGGGIRRRPILRPGEVLESVPGLIVTQHSGDGKANQFFARGYNLDHGTDFATWVAGMPVNMTTHAHGQGYTDLNFIIPELIDRIHYSKGPYYAENGDFASVGSARIGYVNTLPAHLATVTGGSFGFRRALVAGSPELGPGNLLYALEYQAADGPWKLPQNLEKYNGVLRFGQGTATSGFNVTAMAYKARWTSTDQIPLRAVESGLLDRFGNVDPSDGGKSSRYSLSGEWRDSQGDIVRTASWYAVKSRLDLYSNFTYFLDNPVDGDQFQQSEQRTFFGGELTQTWSTRWGERAMSNTLGLQARRDRLHPVALHLTASRNRLDVVREDRVTVANISPFVSNQVQWLPWLRTIAGLRADFYHADVSSNLDANSGKSSDSLVSPKLSAVFGPWARTEYFVNWGRGFHSNDARGTTIEVDPRSGDPQERVQPLARTTGYEVGVRSNPLAGLTTSLALWALKQDSELVFVGDAGNTEASRPSKRRGIEWLVQYVPMSGVAFDVTAAWTRARFDDDDPAGDRIPGAPDKVASAGVTFDHASGWSGALRWRYFGPRPLEETGSVKSKSTSLTNARVGYAVNPKVKLWLDAFNLFDSKDDDITYFYTSRLPGEPAEGVDDIHFHPVEKRAFRLTLSLAF